MTSVMSLTIGHHSLTIDSPLESQASTSAVFCGFGKAFLNCGYGFVVVFGLFAELADECLGKYGIKITENGKHQAYPFISFVIGLAALQIFKDAMEGVADEHLVVDTCVDSLYVVGDFAENYKVFHIIDEIVELVLFHK